MGDIKVSVLIPVYNSEKYIEKCIDSFINQTYKNVEIVCLNDGSTDNSYNILKKYKNKIKVYTQQNSGAAKTRNNLLMHATGEYVMFADADDYVLPDYVSSYVKLLKKHNYDYILGGYRREDAEGNTLSTFTYDTNNLYSKYFILTPWAKIFKRKYLLENNILFPKCKVMEDVLFIINLLTCSKNYTFNTNTGYVNFANEVSLSNTWKKIDANKDIVMLNQYKEIVLSIDNVDKETQELNKYLLLKIIATRLFTVSKINKYKEVVELEKILMEWLRNNYPDYKSNSFLKITQPKGERFLTRLAVYFIFKGNSLGLDKLAIVLYKKLC